MINGKTFKLGEFELEDQELLYLQMIAKRESNHSQFLKQLICIGLVITLIAINMTKGGFGMNFMFILICIGYTTSAIKMNRFE